MKHSRLNLAGRDEEPDRYTHKKQGKRPAHDRAAVLVLKPRPRDVADTIRQRIIEARTDNRALTMDVTRSQHPGRHFTDSLAVRGGNQQACASTTVGHRVFAIRGAPGSDDLVLSLRGRTGVTSSSANLLKRWISAPVGISRLDSLAHYCASLFGRFTCAAQRRPH